MITLANNGSIEVLNYAFSTLVQVLASKTKIYMVLEFVTGGELFDRIVRKLL